MAGSSGQTVRLDSVYFDTADHDLLARGITLRCRTGDADNGWQLKVPTGDARTEIRLEPTGSHTTVPKELAALVAGTRRGKALRHIVTVRTDRTVHRITNAAGELVVEVADDQVDAVAPGRGAATLSSWREIEAELGPAGTEDTLTVIGERVDPGRRHRLDQPEQGRESARCAHPAPDQPPRAAGRQAAQPVTSSGPTWPSRTTP